MGIKLSLSPKEKTEIVGVWEQKLRGIFGSSREEVTGGWRKMHNEELPNLYSSSNIMVIKWPCWVLRSEIIGLHSPKTWNSETWQPSTLSNLTWDQGPEVAFCEYCNEASGSLKGVSFIKDSGPWNVCNPVKYEEMWDIFYFTSSNTDECIINNCIVKTWIRK